MGVARYLIAVLAAGLLLAGCGSSAPQPPQARTLARELGCTVLGQGLRFAAYDVKQDVALQGPSATCAGGEIYTFPDAKAQTDWLHQVQASQAGTLPAYSYLVDGNLWVVVPGSIAADATVIKKAGGKEVTF